MGGLPWVRFSSFFSSAAPCSLHLLPASQPWQGPMLLSSMSLDIGLSKFVLGENKFIGIGADSLLVIGGNTFVYHFVN